MGIFGAISGALAGSNSGSSNNNSGGLGGILSRFSAARAVSGNSNNNSGGLSGLVSGFGANTGVGSQPQANVGVGSQPQANDHTHEDNNNAQPGLQGPAPAVTGSPQGVGAASSQPQLRGMAGMAANKAAIMQAGASNVASQNQTGQDMFGGQSLPEKGAIGVAGMDQMDQF